MPVGVPLSSPLGPQRKNVRHTAAPQELYTNELILETPEQTAMIANAAAMVIASAAPEIVATTPMFTQRVYAEFAKEMRERLLKTNPDWTSQEVISEIGRLWGIHTQTHDYKSTPADVPVAQAPAPAPSRYASSEIPLPNPLYYSATNYPLSPQAFTAAAMEEALNKKLADGPLTTEGPPPSNARSYTKYSDEIRPWIIQTYPRWSVDQIIAETTRLWKMQQEKIKSIKAEVAPPSVPISRTPPPAERRSTAPPPQSETVLVRGPRSTDPVISITKTASATATTRGARAAAAAAAAQTLARTPRQPPVPPGPPPSRGPAANGAAREIDWTKVLSALPKTLPDSKNEGHVLNAIMGVWNANEKK